MMAADDIVPSSDSFWEVDCYKRTVKRQDDGYKLCSELMNLITERGHIEKEYAKQLKGWSKKWTDLIDKGSDYGTSEVACKAVMQEAEKVADLHLEVRERLVNDVHNSIKSWRTENYHKSMVGHCKETKELEDGFKKAQKPWAKRYSKVMKARKDYHSAVKQEKTATNQENNSKNDSAVSLDQVKKMQERVEKCRRDVENTKGKYEEALNDINSYNAKYMEDMTEVFNKCQAQEEKRLKFFKEMLFGIHKCLDLSVNPAYGDIYVKLKEQIGTADSVRDLKYWSEYHGVDMAMNWPTFEEYAPEPHTISRKEKKGNSDAITLTSLKANDTPTHAPVTAQQSYSNYSAGEETHTPPPSASSQVSHNRPPPKPLRKQESYDPSLNPFTDEPDAAETESGPMPSPSQSKASSRVSVSSQSLQSVNSHSSHKSHSSSLDWTNPFANDMDIADDEVILPPRLAVDSGTDSLKADDEKSTATNSSPNAAAETRKTSLTIHALRAGVPVYNQPCAKSNSESDQSESSAQLNSPPYNTAPATPESKRVHRKKGQAPRAPGKMGTDNGSALDEWADDAAPNTEEVMRVPVRALYDYNGQEDDELSFKSGDIFTKLKNEDDQGWCVGEKDGAIGLYPRDYVEVI